MPALSAPDRSKAAPRAKQPTEARQASLIEAALALAAEHCPADVTTAQLAQAIGVTQGAVFRHFESKEAIWLAVFEDTSTRMLALLHQAAAEQTDAVNALQAVFEAHVAFVIAHPGMPRLMFQELQHARETPLKAGVGRVMGAYRQLLLGLLERAQAEGQLAPGTDVMSAAVLFVGAIQGLVIQGLVSGSMDPVRARAPGVFSLLRTGLTGRPSPSALLSSHSAKTSP